MKIYNKLVRDRIPEIIAADGMIPNCQILSEADYRQKLFHKLVEEATEFELEPSIEELADVLEVIHAIAKLQGYTWQELENTRIHKQQERGGFDLRLLLVSVENPK